MSLRRWRRSTGRSLAVVLASFLLLGHVCELSAAADVAAHVHGAEHRSAHPHPSTEPHDQSADHHAGDEACDAVVGLRSPSAGSSDLIFFGAVTALLPVAAVIAPRPVVSAGPHESRARPRRLPLFLLHATLLI